MIGWLADILKKVIINILTLLIIIGVLYFFIFKNFI